MKIIKYIRSTPILLILSIISVSSAFIVIPLVRADTFQNQINALNQQNSSIQGQLGVLSGQSLNYQNQLSDLNSQINAIQNAIYTNQQKQTELNNQIIQNQAELIQQKSVLGNDVRTMYFSAQLTPEEMLATSSSLSQYVDQQVAYEAIQNKIQNTLNQINQLQISLNQQKTQLNQLLQTEQTQNQTLLTDQNQVQTLLNMNQQQQAQYNNQMANNNNQIKTLIAEQAAANASIARNAGISNIPSGGSGGACDIGQGNGGYPMTLCNAYQDAIVDNAGFPNRECTSFANWYFTTVEGQSNFSVSGNAGWWYLTSNYPAITWGGGVKPGALGIEPSSSLNSPVPSLHGGYYGHVMIVLALPGTTYNGSFPYTAAYNGVVPQGYVLVMSMNEDEAGHFMYNLWPINYLMYINPQ